MKKGKWICFPGDYEIMLAEKVMARRYQRDFPIGPFWRVDSPWHNIKFYAEFTLSAEDTLYFSWEGRISVFSSELDGKLIIGETEYVIEKGKPLTLTRRTLSDQRVYAAS